MHDIVVNFFMISNDYFKDVIQIEIVYPIPKMSGQNWVAHNVLPLMHRIAKKICSRNLSLHDTCMIWSQLVSYS